MTNTNGMQTDQQGEYSYASIERLNRRYTHPILAELVRTRFFRFFKVNLDCDCTLWEARGKGQFKADDKQVPKPWRAVEGELDTDGDDASRGKPASVGDVVVLLAENGGRLPAGQHSSPPSTTNDSTAGSVDGDKASEGSAGKDAKPAANGEVHTANGTNGSQEAHAIGNAAADGADSDSDEEETMEWVVDRTLDDETRQALVQQHTWQGFDNPWMSDNGSTEYTYVDLLANPERHTGYKGAKARRVWQAIYANKVMNASDTPEARQESTIFYRLISGMQTSVTVHIARDYLLDERSGERGPNVALFAERVAQPQFKERVQNLYFIFLFVLQAVQQSSELLLGADYKTGQPEEDERTANLVQQLVTSLEMWQPGRVVTAGQELWSQPAVLQRQAELQAHFREISAALDCVTCNKCKLWGKLQMLGLATALKITFKDPHTPVLLLERNEIIAMVNMLKQLSTSIETVRTFSQQMMAGEVDPEKDAPNAPDEELVHQAQELQLRPTKQQEASARHARPLAKLTPGCVRAGEDDDDKFEHDGRVAYGLIGRIVRDDSTNLLDVV